MQKFLKILYAFSSLKNVVANVLRCHKSIIRQYIALTYYCFELCEDFIHIIIARLKKVKMKEIGYQRSVNGQAFTIFGWKNYGLISEMSSRRVDENVRLLQKLSLDMCRNLYL